MKLRKNAGSKKREKSLEISRFLVFPRSDLNWLVIMCLQVNLDAKFVLANSDVAQWHTLPWWSRGLQVTAIFRACRTMFVNELIYITFESKFLSVHPSFLFVVTAIPKSIVAIPNNSILIPFIANTSVTNLNLFFEFFMTLWTFFRDRPITNKRATAIRTFHHGEMIYNTTNNNHCTD